jgi:putative transposase
MPEHVHLLMSEPPATTPSTVMQVLKQRSSRQIQVLCSGAAHEIPRFCERRFHDFNIRTWEKLNEKLTYMHMNPVQRELVTEPQLWRWSSFQSYAKGVGGKIQLDIVPWARSEQGLEEFTG